MRTVEVSRMAVVVAVAGAILASTLSGCVVRDRTREESVPYPVVVGSRPPAPWYGHPPRPWYAGPNRPWFGGPRPYPQGERWKYADRDDRHGGHGGHDHDRYPGFHHWDDDEG